MTGKKPENNSTVFLFLVDSIQFSNVYLWFHQQTETSATCNTLVFAGILTIITDLKKKAFLLIRLHLYA